MRIGYKHTKRLCYCGYIVQAIVNNFVPLLFVFFHERFGIPLIKITFIVTFNFFLQLCVDIASALFVDRLGYRRSVILSNFLSATGLILLTVLTEVMENTFAGILISVSVYAVGGGLLEVIINPILEGCPSKNKHAAMSILHSFYSWGCAGVILISTLFFVLVGIDHWRVLTLIWTVLPIFNTLMFKFVPIPSQLNNTKEKTKASTLLKNRVFWIMLLMMLCAGASEMTVSQWVSAFAESGLGVSKTIGDIAGTMFFSVLFGLSRTIYGKMGDRIDLLNFMKISAIICAAAYLIIVLSPCAMFSLIGCGIAGFSVGVFWPGTVSLTAGRFKNGGTLMFSLLAFAGDVGCTAGPTLAGGIAAAEGDSIKFGIGVAAVFPMIMAVCICKYIKSERTKSS